MNSVNEPAPGEPGAEDEDADDEKGADDRPHRAGGWILAQERWDVFVFHTKILAPGRCQETQHRLFFFEDKSPSYHGGDSRMRKTFSLA